MWHLYAQKNLVWWRQWKAVLQQKAMLFSAEEWYNPNIHLEKEANHCFVFMLQYPSFFLFLFFIFTWQKLLLTIVWPIHSDTQLLERAEPHASSLQWAASTSLCIPDWSSCTGTSTSASETSFTHHKERSPWPDCCSTHLSDRSGSGQRNRITK